MAKKRQVEVFTAGCLLCDETVQLVRELACPSCDVTVYDSGHSVTAGSAWIKSSNMGSHPSPRWSLTAGSQIAV